MDRPAAGQYADKRLPDAPTTHRPYLPAMLTTVIFSELRLIPTPQTNIQRCRPFPTTLALLLEKHAYPRPQ